jgi:hypothetical protein
MWNHYKSTVFLDYIRNTLHIVATHTKAFHMSENNLPVLTDKYDKSVLPSGVQLIRQVWLTLWDPSNHQFALGHPPRTPSWQRGDQRRHERDCRKRSVIRRLHTILLPQSSIHLQK